MVIDRNSEQAHRQSLKYTYPIGMKREWITVPNTSPESADTIPGDQTTIVTASSSRRHIRNDGGTNLILRLKYDDGLSSITDPIIKVLGIDYNLKYHWLTSSAAALTATLTTDATNNLADGTFKYTDVGAATIFDLQGSTEVIVYVSTALAGTGTVNNSTFEYKIV